MQVTRSSIATRKAPAENFTGDVYIDAVAEPTGASRFVANLVHFTPGARTNWHTHAHGQTIYVLEGVGRCQRRGGRVEEIRPGDRVVFEADEEHWHGAAHDRFMLHIAIQDTDDAANSAIWGDPVTDAEYGGE